jgi:hypothetical protein
MVERVFLLCEVWLMLSQEEFDRLLGEARDRVQSMDETDGFKDRYSGTIYAALEAGLKNPESGAAFDALVMLRDVTYSDRPLIARRVLTPSEIASLLSIKGRMQK